MLFSTLLWHFCLRPRWLCGSYCTFLKPQHLLQTSRHGFILHLRSTRHLPSFVTDMMWIPRDTNLVYTSRRKSQEARAEHALVLLVSDMLVWLTVSLNWWLWQERKKAFLEKWPVWNVCQGALDFGPSGCRWKVFDVGKGCGID